MPLAPDNRPEWLTFDCYGTLIQWDEGLKDVAARVIGAKGGGADPAAIVAHYDQHESELEKSTPFKTFRQVAPAAFRTAMGELGIDAMEADGQALLDAIPGFIPFPETLDALASLKAGGFRIALISNTDDDLVAGTITQDLERSSARPGPPVVERNQSVAALQIVGGHPSLDLANTVVNRRDSLGPHDRLTSYDDLLDWSVRVDLLDQEQAARLRRLASAFPTAAAAALERAKALREALFRLFSAVASGRAAAGADLDHLGREAAQAQARRQLTHLPAGYAWVWHEDDLDGITARVAHAAAELLTRGDTGRVKECLGAQLRIAIPGHDAQRWAALVLR